ncbi:ankyrin [Microthyrium microscopicum]|uniref:Ankyrin n=1 Tax=Microthyrium microscopicum TaxID=703497 RepID=A0A6A6TX93_9PEZI|nr:ankyrin [Microthyrium microscopicum]
MTAFGSLGEKFSRRKHQKTNSTTTVEQHTTEIIRERDVKSPFGFNSEKHDESSHIDEIINQDSYNKEIYTSNSRPESHNLLSPTTDQFSTNEKPTHQNRLSRRISLAIAQKQTTHQHARKTSDLTALLCEASAVGNTQSLGRILGAGGSLEKKNADGLTPLHVAAMAGQGDAVRCLVRMGASMDVKDSHGYLPIHRAVMSNQTHLVAHLVNLGVDVNAVDSKGRAALHLAAAQRQVVSRSTSPANASRRTSQTSQLRFSFAFGGQQDIHSRRPSTASARSVYDDCSMIEALVRAGADVEIRNKEGETPLHVACREGITENARLLLDAGAVVNVRNEAGLTALGVLAAAEECNDSLSALLLERGAQVTPITSSAPAQRMSFLFGKSKE